jgi:hypothetical protein
MFVSQPHGSGTIVAGAQRAARSMPLAGWGCTALADTSAITGRHGGDMPPRVQRTRNPHDRALNPRATFDSRVRGRSKMATGSSPVAAPSLPTPPQLAPGCTAAAILSKHSAPHGQSGNAVCLTDPRVRRGRGAGSGLDALLLAMDEAKLAVVEWDAATRGLRSSSLHSYEHVVAGAGLKHAPLRPLLSPFVTADPLVRCPI